MDFSRLLAIFLLTNTKAVVLLVCTGVGGCLCPMISSACHSGIASLLFMKRAPSSASAAEDITALMIWETVRTAPLFDGMELSLDMKKCPPALLLAFGSEKYDASLCAASTISEARYVIMASV